MRIVSVQRVRVEPNASLTASRKHKQATGISVSLTRTKWTAHPFTKSNSSGRCISEAYVVFVVNSLGLLGQIPPRRRLS